MAELYHEKEDLSMAIRTYLAMTATEFAKANPLPPYTAWMACHFSPYGSGLSNLPSVLPPDSLLILNDRIPMRGHDPQRIAEQLKTTIAANHCCGLLLDFQRTDCKEAAVLAQHLIFTLSCPVCVSDLYAANLDCPVFLSPCPHHLHLDTHIAPWKKRVIWLDLAHDVETITVSCHGSTIIPSPPGVLPEGGHADTELHCHYSIETRSDSVQFTFWRTKEDLQALAAEAEASGTEGLVGLYCELGYNGSL